MPAAAPDCTPLALAPAAQHLLPYALLAALLPVRLVPAVLDEKRERVVLDYLRYVIVGVARRALSRPPLLAIVGLGNGLFWHGANEDPPGSVAIVGDFVAGRAQRLGKGWRGW
ncbi:hypothetical protein C8R44DRAFT_770477 [Mycena epipterygia]|nr:hypothetical protein C8R44DRAFT_770477 [Mycena epipterygia]